MSRREAEAAYGPAAPLTEDRALPPSLWNVRSDRSGWREAVLGGLGLWAAVRILLTGYALLVASTSNGIPVQPAVPKSFFTLFFHWDSSYFLAIAQRGYFAAGNSVDLPAFLPGYPLAARLATVTLFPAGSLSTTETLVGLWTAAAIPGAIASIGLWRMTSERFGPRVAFGATLLLLAGPYAVFLQASYSEPLFLAFAVFAWYQALKGRWWAAGILGACASLTRIDGLFLAVALGVLYLQSTGTAWRRHLPRAIGLVAASASSLLGYFVYLFAATGDPVAWLTAERHGWHRHFTLPWTSGLRTLWAALNTHASPAHRAQSLLEVVFAVLCIAAAIALARRRRWGAVVLVVATLASLMTSTTYLSLSRESLLLFPITILVATTRDAGRRRWVYRAALAFSIVLLLFNTHQFVLGLWAQ